MEKVKLSIQYSDSEYSKALSKALSLNYDNISISNSNPDVVLNDSLAPAFLSVQFYYEKIMALSNRVAGPTKPQEDVLYVGFSSPVGGGGLTTTALCFARIQSRIFKKKTGFCSFDPWFRNSFDKEDEFGIQYFDELPSEADIDIMVLDIPSSFEKSQDLLDMCEKRVVISGFNEQRISLIDAFYNSLNDSAKTYIIPPKTYKFENHFDQNPNPSDIHGQLGKEMLEFVNELEREQT